MTGPNGVNGNSNKNVYVKYNSDINFNDKKYDLSSIFTKGTAISQDLQDIFANIDKDGNGILEEKEIEQLNKSLKLKPGKKMNLKSLMKVLGIKKEDAGAVKKLYAALNTGSISETTTKDGWKISTSAENGVKTIEIRDKNGVLRKSEFTNLGVKTSTFYDENGKMTHTKMLNLKDNTVETIYFNKSHEVNTTKPEAENGAKEEVHEDGVFNEETEYGQTTTEYKNGLKISEEFKGYQDSDKKLLDNHTKKEYIYNEENKLIGEKVTIIHYDDKGNVSDEETSTIQYTYNPDESILETIHSEEHVNGKVIKYEIKQTRANKDAQTTMELYRKKLE